MVRGRGAELTPRRRARQQLHDDPATNNWRQEGWCTDGIDASLRVPGLFPGAFDVVQIRLNLRDALELDIEIVPQPVHELGPVVQPSDNLIELRARDDRILARRASNARNSRAGSNGHPQVFAQRPRLSTTNPATPGRPGTGWPRGEHGCIAVGYSGAMERKK